MSKVNVKIMGVKKCEGCDTRVYTMGAMFMTTISTNNNNSYNNIKVVSNRDRAYLDIQRHKKEVYK